MPARRLNGPARPVTVTLDAQVLFDFDQAVYGKRIVVEFLHKLRDEARFPDLDALARQIRADADAARAYFATAS